MKFTHIPILEYINTEQQVDIHIHTKDKRMILLSDIQTNPYIDSQIVSIDHCVFGRQISFVLLREDFSHLEYIVKSKKSGEYIKDSHYLTQDLI